MKMFHVEQCQVVGLMSSYTMQLREYIEMWTQDTDSMSIRDRIETGRTKLFDFDYPIFDSNYKKDFETKFIRRFYQREIGAETEGAFKFNLETYLIINMPYWNKMFESELIEYDPLENSKATSSHSTTKDRKQNDTRNRSGDSTSNGSSNETNSDTTQQNNFNRQLFEDTPDGRLSITPNEDGSGTIEYASSIGEDKENNFETKSGESNQSSNVTQNENENSSLNSDINESESFSQTRSGKIGVQTYAEMLQKHRDAFLRIENKIFSEMQQLFMLVG